MSGGLAALAGTWRLIEWVAEDDNGVVNYPLGPDAIGVICYTEDGFVHVHIMAAERVPHASPDTMGGTVEEDSRSAKSHISYSGRWHIEDGKVIHEVAISSFPNWAPSRQLRHMRFVDEDLELSADPMVWGDRHIRHRLRWARAA